MKMVSLGDHLQMMKNIEGGRPQSYILSLQRTQTSLI